MAGKRQPTSVVQANGKKHLTKAEIDQRLDGEVQVETPEKAKPPKWLPQILKKDFRALGSQLIAAGLYADLDADTLGRYLVAHSQWLKATAMADKALDHKDSEAASDWGGIQDRYFKQARNCATDMGLTVTSRCRLVVPPAMNPQNGDGDGDDEFTRELHLRQECTLNGTR